MKIFALPIIVCILFTSCNLQNNNADQKITANDSIVEVKASFVTDTVNVIAQNPIKEDKSCWTYSEYVDEMSDEVTKVASTGFGTSAKINSKTFGAFLILYKRENSVTISIRTFMLSSNDSGFATPEMLLIRPIYNTSTRIRFDENQFITINTLGPRTLSNEEVSIKSEAEIKDYYSTFYLKPEDEILSNLIKSDKTKIEVEFNDGSNVIFNFNTCNLSL
ncbi:MAG: hypothetical protein KBF75_14040 [Saprospiraceae bacterium]|nr:hypothetical protein [Saprospiraceae bacterium]